MPKKSKRLKKHKSHNDKKHKKHKKKYSESEFSSSISDNDSLSDCEWVEKKTEPKTGAKHDDWMMDATFVPTYSIDDKRSKKDGKEESFMDKPGQSDRELNPYWKDGGTGLPTERHNRDEYRRSRTKKEFMKPDDDDRNYHYESSHNTKSRWRKEPRSHDAKRSFMIPEDDDKRNYSVYENSQSTGRWRKQPTRVDDKSEDTKKEERRRYEETKRREESTGKEETRRKDEYRREAEGPMKPESSKNSGLLSDEEMNALASKILKAEILGNQALVDQLKEKLENARRARQEKTESCKVIVLPDFDSRKTIEERFVEEENTTDKSRKEKDKMKKDKEREMQQAINKHKRAEKVLDNCTWCLTNNKLQKHLIVSKSDTCYLCVPHFHSLTDGHCLIVPSYHSTCITLLDEDVWEEVLTYCKKLVKMFRDEDQDVVFFETAVNFRHHPHMVLHCVPIPYESGNLAPIYFKKAIQECEKEWAINKKLVEYKKMDIRKSVPKELPYFMVNFGMDSGFAHVIEEEQYFPKNFAQEIIGGMLDLDHLIWRKQQSDDFETQCKKVNKFKELWKKIES